MCGMYDILQSVESIFTPDWAFFFLLHAFI